MNGYFDYQQNFVRDSPNDGYNYASLAIALNTPRSRGNVLIQSADAAVQPLINSNWLTDPADIEVAAAGFKRARTFFKTEAIQPILIGPEYFPGPQVSTDAKIEPLLRKSFNTIFHASCTCFMGRPGNEAAVVDSHAKVIGVQRLRVVDASAFPFLPPGHPRSTICKCAFERLVLSRHFSDFPFRCARGKDCVRYFGCVLRWLKGREEGCGSVRLLE